MQMQIHKYIVLLRITRFDLGSAHRHWYMMICTHDTVLNPTHSYAEYDTLEYLTNLEDS